MYELICVLDLLLGNLYSCINNSWIFLSVSIKGVYIVPYPSPVGGDFKSFRTISFTREREGKNRKVTREKRVRGKLKRCL